MSAAYYDLYGEEGALFVVKLNILDKDGKSVNLDKTAKDSHGTDIPLYIPEELKAVGVNQVTDIKATLSLKSNLFDEDPLLLFTTDDSVYTGNDTIGRILLKKGTQADSSLDHNVILYRKMTQSLIISGVPTALELVDGGIGIAQQGYVTDSKGTQIKLTVGRVYNDEAPVHPYDANKPYPYPKYAGNAGTNPITHCTGTVTSATIVKTNATYNVDELITFKSLSPDISELTNSSDPTAKYIIKSDNQKGTIKPGTYTCGVSSQVSTVPSYFGFKVATPYCSNDGSVPTTNPPFDDTCSVPFTGSATTSSYGSLGVTANGSIMQSAKYADVERYVPVYPFRWSNSSKKIPASAAWNNVELSTGDVIKFPVRWESYIHTDKGPNNDLPLNRADYPLDCANFDPVTASCPDGVQVLMTIDNIDFPNASFPCFDQNGNITSQCQEGKTTNSAGLTVPTWQFDHTTAQIKGYLKILYKVSDGSGGTIDKIAPLHTSRWDIISQSAAVDYYVKYGQGQDTGSCIEQCSRDFFWASPKCQNRLKPVTPIGAHNCGAMVGTGQIARKKPYTGTPTQVVNQDMFSLRMPTVYAPTDGARHDQIIGQMLNKHDVGSGGTSSGCLSASMMPFPPKDLSTGQPCELNPRPYFYLSCDANSDFIERYTIVNGNRVVNEKCYLWKYSYDSTQPTKTNRGDYLTKIVDNNCGCIVESYMTDDAKKSGTPDVSFDIAGKDNDLVRFKSPIFKVSEVKSTYHSVLGTHFYDLEFTFTTKTSSNADPIDYTLRMIQGKFVITPEVTKG